MIGYNLKSNSIFIISDSFLQHVRAPQNNPADFTFNGQLVFQGTIPDYFFLAGVEEMHHAIEAQGGKIDYNNTIIPGNANVQITSYDNQPHEFRALGWKLRAAIDTGMNHSSITSLQYRLQRAIATKPQD
jgi:hypothetical protein